MSTEKENPSKISKQMLKNGPELAQLQIRLLDQMITQLKQRRLNVGEQMSKDKETMSWIDRDTEDAKKKLAPLQKELDIKRKLREDLENKKLQCIQQFEDMTNLAKTQMEKTMKSQSKITAKQNSFQLEQTRGYSMVVKPASKTIKK